MLGEGLKVGFTEEQKLHKKKHDYKNQENRKKLDNDKIMKTIAT